MKKVVPLPMALLTAMRPLLCAMKSLALYRPKPEPLDASLVVKNGSQMRAWNSSGMPQPLSENSMIAPSRGAGVEAPGALRKRI